jgi:hypothetical protein
MRGEARRRPMDGFEEFEHLREIKELEEHAESET